MWIINAIVIILVLLAAEAMLFIPDKMPWHKKENKFEDRWWEK